MNMLDLQVNELTKMRTGKCRMSLEGVADVDGSPKKLHIELEFKVETVRAVVRAADLHHEPIDACPCESIDLDRHPQPLEEVGG